MSMRKVRQYITSHLTPQQSHIILSEVANQMVCLTKKLTPCGRTSLTNQRVQTNITLKAKTIMEEMIMRVFLPSKTTLKCHYTPISKAYVGSHEPTRGTATFSLT